LHADAWATAQRPPCKIQDLTPSLTDPVAEPVAAISACKIQDRTLDPLGPLGSNTSRPKGSPYQGARPRAFVHTAFASANRLSVINGALNGCSSCRARRASDCDQSASFGHGAAGGSADSGK
jgi:hypothetical protein